MYIHLRIGEDYLEMAGKVVYYRSCLDALEDWDMGLPLFLLGRPITVQSPSNQLQTHQIPTIRYEEVPVTMDHDLHTGTSLLVLDTWSCQ